MRRRNWPRSRASPKASWRALAQLITVLENGSADAKLLQAIRLQAGQRQIPVLGITGTGGAASRRSPTN
jgi:methylmalonyl-CoA mutase